MSDIVTPVHDQRKRDELVLWKADVRRAVKAIGLHRSEVDVCIAILNHYWAINKGKNNARGMGHNVAPVHPGSAKIAKTAGVSNKAALLAMRLLRKLGILKLVGFAKGGRGFSQRFLINFQDIYALKGVEKSDIQALRPKRKAGNKGGHKQATVADGLKTLITEKSSDQGNVLQFSNYHKPPKGRPL